MIQTAIKLEGVSKSFNILRGEKRSIFNLMFSFNDTSRNYKKLQALDDISFQVTNGEMLGIIGRNASGKSTLLSVIARIFLPDTGKVMVSGRVTPLLGLGTGFNDELTAKENIILYGLFLGLTKKGIEGKADKIIEFAELEDFIHTKLKHFSSGMRARLAFSTALQVEPDILLVDEILAVGDVLFKKKSYNAFKNFISKNRTILFVSHDMSAIKELCNKVIVLEKGKISFYGEPTHAIEHYNSIMNSSS